VVTIRPPPSKGSRECLFGSATWKARHRGCRTCPSLSVCWHSGLPSARTEVMTLLALGQAECQVSYPDGAGSCVAVGRLCPCAGGWRGVGVRRLAELCGGVGADAIALARAGIEVLAVDRGPRTCAVARANAEALGLGGLIEVRCADVTEVHTGGYDAVFVDPA